MNESQELARKYVSALMDYINGAGEDALFRGFELGREAVRNGLGILDIVSLNEETQITLLERASNLEEGARITRAAAKFLMEVLAPLEMKMEVHEK